MKYPSYPAITNNQKTTYHKTINHKQCNQYVRTYGSHREVCNNLLTPPNNLLRTYGPIVRVAGLGRERRWRRFHRFKWITFHDGRRRAHLVNPFPPRSPLRALGRFGFRWGGKRITKNTRANKHRANKTRRTAPGKNKRANQTNGPTHTRANKETGENKNGRA